MLRGLPVVLIGCSALDADPSAVCREVVQFIGPAETVPMGWSAQNALVAFGGARESALDTGDAVRVDIRHLGGLVHFIQSEGGFAEPAELDPWTCRTRIAVEVEVVVEVGGLVVEESALLEVAEPITAPARARIVGESFSIERTEVSQSGELVVADGVLVWTEP